MKASGEIKGEALWEVSTTYKLFADLPVNRAVKSVMTDVIHYALNNNEDITAVMSLGIGTGELYKGILRKDIIENKLRVLGVEPDKVLVDRCVEDFPGNYMESSNFVNVTDNCSCVIHRSLVFPHEIYENTMNFVEARFALHQILFRKTIMGLIRRVYKVLKNNGVFIVGDIDHWIGSYIEKKVLTLTRYYNEIEVDPKRALLLAKKQKVVEIPILDRTSHADNEAIKSLMNTTLEPLNTEVQDTTRIGWEESVNSDFDDGIKGRKWYRTKEDWEEMIVEGFENKVDIRTISPQEIRKKYPDVRDNPFILMATKTE